MADPNKPVVIEAGSEDASATKKNSHSGTQQENHIKSSQHRLAAIAAAHHIDAKLHDIEHDTLTTRAAYRQLEIKQQQQANLEQIIKIAHDLCRDETASSPDPDWLYRFSRWRRASMAMACKIYGQGSSSRKSSNPAAPHSKPLPTGNHDPA